MWRKVVIVAHLDFDSVEFLVRELYDATALKANQVVVSLPTERFFVPGTVFAESVLKDQTAFDKQIERVIHGCTAGFQSPSLK